MPMKKPEFKLGLFSVTRRLVCAKALFVTHTSA
jgi:hypothetical protein